MPDIKLMNDTKTYVDSLIGQEPLTIGEKIKRARFISGQTARQLCEKLNISSYLLSRYENDKVKNVDAELLKRINECCGIEEL